MSYISWVGLDGAIYWLDHKETFPMIGMIFTWLKISLNFFLLLLYECRWCGADLNLLIL